VGDLVYTTEEGAITVAPLLQVGRTPVQDHHVVRVVLADGRLLEISGGHPTADGRTFSDLHGGSVIDGHPIVTAQVIPYAHAFTYDILPASRSGNYFAAGVLVGSTLSPGFALSSLRP